MNRAIVQSSTAEGCQHVIEWIMKHYGDVSSTIPVQAADGSYMASVHYGNVKEHQCGL